MVPQVPCPNKALIFKQLVNPQSLSADARWQWKSNRFREAFSEKPSFRMGTGKYTPLTAHIGLHRGPSRSHGTHHRDPVSGWTGTHPARKPSRNRPVRGAESERAFNQKRREGSRLFLPIMGPKIHDRSPIRCSTIVGAAAPLSHHHRRHRRRHSIHLHPEAPRRSAPPGFAGIRSADRGTDPS